jgi:hypothetical protein
LILADTTVWAGHFRRADGDLVRLLGDGQVVTHPFVTGALALGDPEPGSEAVSMLRALPRAATASESELLAFVAHARLAGTGLGFVDVHLLAACRLTPGVLLWSRDRRLADHAGRLGVGWSPE